MKLNKIKIKLGKQVVKSPRLLKEEKLELLACIKEEKDPEILECLLHEYDEPDLDKVAKKIDSITPKPLKSGSESSTTGRGAMSYALIHYIAKRKYKACMKNASKIKDPSERKKHADSCVASLQTIKDYV